MPGKRNRVMAMELIQAERAKIRSAGTNGVYPDDMVDYWLGVAEEALEEAAREIAACKEDLRVRIGQVAHYKGMLAARDGKETILTFDRIGTEGVPVHFEDGTLLKCTDSDRQWVLLDSEWHELHTDGTVCPGPEECERESFKQAKADGAL